MTLYRYQRRRTRGYRSPPNTVYCGRPTKWGNPFPAGRGALHASELVRMFNVYIAGHYGTSAPSAEEMIEELRGKRIDIEVANQ